MKIINQLFTDFYASLEETIQENWAIADDRSYHEALCANVSIIVPEIIKIGNTAFQQLQNATITKRFTEENLSLLITNYLWSSQMKSYILLWRDIIFQTQKAMVLQWDNRFSDADFAALKAASFDQIRLATDRISYFNQKQIAAIKMQKNGLENRISEWELEQNPWTVYKRHFLLIQQQCNDLLMDFHKIHSNFNAFQRIRQLIIISLETYEMTIQAQEDNAMQTIQFIDENIETKPGKVASHTKNLEGRIEHTNLQETFKSTFESILTELQEKFNVVIKTKEGIVQTKEINIKRRVKQWTESEILPLMYEVWEIQEFITDNLKMALMNIQNRTSIVSNDLKQGKMALNVEEVDVPLNVFLKKTKQWKNDLAELFQIIKNRLNEQFKISNVYDEKNEFLPIPLQSTISQYWFAETKLYQRLSMVYDLAHQRFKQFVSTVEQETSLSISEKIVRYVQRKKILDNNHHYTSIFLTKGYIGEAFWVERTNEIQHIKTLIFQWQLGFRGSVLLHGQRFSGKTLFGEMIANRYFANNMIRLLPNSTIQFSGRKFQTTYDLEAALDFIRKYNTNAQPLVWIDDIELWANEDILVTQNIRTLKKYIDNYSNNIFFMVSMSNWAREHFNNIYEINKVFQADFNLDKMNVEEIQRAILIRHGATHRTLVDDNQQEITKNQLRKIINRVSKTANGNIGEALNWWAMSITQVNEDCVQFHFNQNHLLPDFINPDIGVVLATIMMEKRTNDYRLSKLFGKSFQSKYKNIIQRLISVGLLTRHLDGDLEVNDLVVNEVGRLLEHERYLKFS